MDFTEYDTRLSSYAVIVDDEDRILLALFNQGPTPAWTLPGGGVELHETVEQATVRELREETGYDVELGGVLGVDSWVIPVEERIYPTERPLKSVRVMFEGRVVGGELTHELDGTTDEARWIPLRDVPGLPHVRLVASALRLLDATRS